MGFLRMLHSCCVGTSHRVPRPTLAHQPCRGGMPSGLSETGVETKSGWVPGEQWSPHPFPARTIKTKNCTTSRPY